MDGFMLVLLIAWIVLLAALAAMGWMDRAVNREREKRSSTAGQNPDPKRG